MSIELVQFRFSPYNEKVRWALDLKRIPHRRKSVLPGPHRPYVQRLSGQSATPVLRLEGRWIAGSAAILDALDAAVPTPPLWPLGADRSLGALIEQRFDEDWGPRMRRAILAALMTDLDYLCACFAGHAPGSQRMIYRALAPFAKGMIAKGNGIAGPISIRDGAVAAREALDFVESQRGGNPYLAGDSFSGADLAAASHLAVLCDPPGSSMDRPTPRPKALRELLSTFATHPGIAWTLGVYREHRGPRADFEGGSGS